MLHNDGTVTAFLKLDFRQVSKTIGRKPLWTKLKKLPEVVFGDFQNIEISFQIIL